jgi:hypothetical protein
LAQSHGPFRLTSRTRANSAEVNASIGLNRAMPALLTRISRPEYSYSRWTDHSIHLCFRTPRARFPRTRLLSHVPIVIGTLPVIPTTSWACDLRFDAFPSRDIAPSRPSVGLALIQRSSLRSPPHDRPHVSLSEAFLSAFASCGILPDTPYGWHLLTTSVRARIGLLRSQFPLFASVGRCFPPGFSAVHTG